MYKTRITRWGLDKRNKKPDMEAIVRKHFDRQRIGKNSTFRVRDKAIDYADVLRYWQRRGVSIDDVIARRAASTTPDAVQCFTPIPSPVRTPEVLAVPEMIFVTIRDYHLGCFDAGVWEAGDGSNHCRTTKPPFDSGSQMIRLGELCFMANDLFGRSRPQEAGMALVAATANIRDIVLGEDPHTLNRLLNIIRLLHGRGTPEIASAILQQFSAMGETLLGRKHPLRLVCGWLASTSDTVQTNYVNIIFQSVRTSCEVFESVLGPLHRTSVSARLFLLMNMTSNIDSSSRETLFTKLLHECEGTLGPHDTRTLEVRLDLAWTYHSRSNFIEANSMARSILAQGDSSDSIRSYALEVLARSLYDLGETQEAEIQLRTAIDSERSHWGQDDGLVQRWMLKLEGWLEARGDLESSAQVRRERIALWEPTILVDLDQ